jgi:CheY-like chemotaxis protein
MTSTRPRLVLLKGTPPPDAEQLQNLQEAFDIVEAQDAAEARAILESGEGVVLCSPDQLTDSSGEVPPRSALAILQQFGEGIGVVDNQGEMTWANRRLRSQSPNLRESFRAMCLEALETMNDVVGATDIPRAPQRTQFSVNDDLTYELVVTAASSDHDGSVKTVVGVLWDITKSKALDNKIAAIDAAGSELMTIESSDIAKMNMAQRLKWLEDKIVQYVHDLLNFDNFEIRLLNKETKQLELVIAVGLAPLKIGETIYASKEGNGISGYVAATGQSYICKEVRHDPMYREGLDNAGSSLTVPLKLHDDVIGVFNAESFTPNSFNETDRRFAEIFGRYIAIAMNILDLMLIERYTTNEQVSNTVLREIDEPLAQVTTLAAKLLKQRDTNEATREGLNDILQAASGIRERIAACCQGPRSILGAEAELRKHDVDPLMAGKRVLVADDEPNIRDTISSILTQKGCTVTVCSNGGETIERLDAAAAKGMNYDLVISDIKMPDRNGYEVFRAAKSINSDLPVILMTGFGYDPHHSIVRSSQEGLDLFLFKPFKATQLLEAITKSLTQDE